MMTDDKKMFNGEISEVVALDRAVDVTNDDVRFLMSELGKANDRCRALGEELAAYRALFKRIEGLVTTVAKSNELRASQDQGRSKA